MKIYKIFLFTVSICIIILLASYSQLLNTYPNRKIQILKKKLVCIVLTTENSFQNRAIVAWKTWTQKCDQTLFACNCSNFAINKNYTDVPFLQLNITENYNKMDVKVIQTLNETYKIYNKNYYWFLLVDEDTYVFVDNAKRFMSKINQTVVFGDLLVGLCSERSNVTLGNSLDELGRERFHAINMRTSYKGPPQDWLYSYCSNTPKFDKECCSEQSITFHYTSPQEMIEYSKLKDESNLTVIFNKL
jgi:hypothetical protein